MVDGGPVAPTGRGSSIHSYLWYAARSADAPDSVVTLRRFRYGVAPDGMTASGPIAPLTPGGYSISVRAGSYEADGHFEIDRAGNIR